MQFAQCGALQCAQRYTSCVAGRPGEPDRFDPGGRRAEARDNLLPIRHLRHLRSIYAAYRQPPPPCRRARVTAAVRAERHLRRLDGDLCRLGGSGSHGVPRNSERLSPRNGEYHTAA